MIKSFMQVLGNTLASFFVPLENNDQDNEKITVACRKLETVAIEIFADHGWRCNNRVCT
jgi:hypothetical protein